MCVMRHCLILILFDLRPLLLTLLAAPTTNTILFLSLAVSYLPFFRSFIIIFLLMKLFLRFFSHEWFISPARHWNRFIPFGGRLLLLLLHRRLTHNGFAINRRIINIRIADFVLCAAFNWLCGVAGGGTLSGPWNITDLIRTTLITGDPASCRGTLSYTRGPLRPISLFLRVRFSILDSRFSILVFLCNRRFFPSFRFSVIVFVFVCVCPMLVWFSDATSNCVASNE